MPGRPFLQIPGPTLVPERVMRAMAQAVIDHRGPTFGALVHDCLAGLKDVFQPARGQIVLYPGSGTGAGEAALVNTLSPGDRVLACVNGHFSTGFANTAAAYGMDVERLEVAYGEGVPAERVAARLAADGAHELRAILVVHNETSTGVTSNVAAVRAALDDARHPALLREALAMLRDEGLPNVFARHARLAEACRRAVRALGLGILCKRAEEHSNTLTAVVMPSGFDSDAFVRHAAQKLDLSLGVGLGAVKGTVFRIGHLGSLNELELLGGLAGVELMLKDFGVPIRLGAGVTAAEEFLLA